MRCLGAKCPQHLVKEKWKLILFHVKTQYLARKWSTHWLSHPYVFRAGERNVEMFFLKLEVKLLSRITAVEKPHCYTLANFNNLIHLVTSLIRRLCFLYICCYLITNIFIFTICTSLPWERWCQWCSKTVLMGSQLITACMEGDWDLGAQWGVTPLSRAGCEGRQLVINGNDTRSWGVSNDE